MGLDRGQKQQQEEPARASLNESGCYLDPHRVGMWLDEALDDRRREAIKIRSRPRPLRPGEAADGAVSRL